MVPDDLDDDDEPRAPAWSAPRTTPGAMGAALDDVFGVPSPGADAEPDERTADDDDGDKDAADDEETEDGDSPATEGAT